VYNILKAAGGPPFINFRDASKGAPLYHLSLLDCLMAVSKAHQLGFFDFDDFDTNEFEFFEVSYHTQFFFPSAKLTKYAFSLNSAWKTVI